MPTLFGVSSIKGGLRAPEARRGHCQVGSLAGAAHLLNDNTGDLRSVQCERKSHVEFKGKS